MSALPRALGRRIDRLARRAHAFHRFAHHPLCGAYAPEVFRLGRRARLCRGCSLAFAGTAAGGAAAAALPAPGGASLLGALLALGAVAGWLAALGTSRASRAAGKWPSRFAPALATSALAVLGLRRGDLAGAAVALGAAALVGLALHRYRRRGPDRSACEGCPERSGPRTCSGLRPIARREAAFQRLAGRWIERARPAASSPASISGVPSAPQAR